MDLSEQSNYNLFYIKRQEQLLFEYMKKSIDYEVKLAMLMNSSEESKKNLEIQNDINQQALRSVEDLTIKNKNFEAQIEQLTARNTFIEKGIQESNRNKEALVQERDKLSFRINDLEKEIQRQKEEMQQLFDENVELKEINNKKTINKKKPVEPTAVLLEDNVF